MKINKKMTTFMSATILVATSAMLNQAMADTLYVATNKADANTVAAFTDNKGKYTLLGEYKTGGKGTGDLEVPSLKKDPKHPLANGDDPLISAYGITSSDDGKYILVVNAGQSSVSLMSRAADNSLTAINSQPTSDKFPLSVAISGNKVVVASVGDDNGIGSISAFLIKDGSLVAVPDSRRDLSARPSTVKFSTDGKFVVLSELVSGKIKAYSFTDNLSQKPTSTIDSPKAKDRFQAIPVGFDIKHSGGKDYVLMSEARFLTPDFKLRASKGYKASTLFPQYSWQTGSVSSYQLDDKGQLTLVDGDKLTGKNVEGDEIANCWVVLSKDGKHLWTANALSSSISLFDVADNGKTTLVNQTAYKDKGEKLFFGDITLSKDGKTLYQLVGNEGKVLFFNVEGDKLTLKGEVSGLPKLGSYGLLAL